MNDNLHSGWEALTQIVLSLAWAVAFFGYHGAPNKAPAPKWLNVFQGVFLFSLGATKGLVIVADRLAAPIPNLFPLVYLGFFIVFFAPVWFLTSDTEGFNFRTISLVILYLIPVTIIFALGWDKFDPVLASPYRFVPVIVLAMLLLGVWIFKKSERRSVIVAAFFACGIVGWMAVISWVATKVS